MHSLDLTTPLKDAFSERLLGLLPGRAEDYCLQFCGRPAPMRWKRR